MGTVEHGLKFVKIVVQLFLLFQFLLCLVQNHLEKMSWKMIGVKEIRLGSECGFDKLFWEIEIGYCMNEGSD